MKRFVPYILAASVAFNLVQGLFAWNANKGEVERAAKAKVVLTQLDNTVKLVGEVARQRDSALRVIDSLQAHRQATAARTAPIARRVAVVPAEKPDTCLPWIKRSLAQDTVISGLESQLADADSQVSTLRNVVRQDTLAIDSLTTALGNARPIVEEATKPQSRRPSFGKRLLTGLTSALTPYAAVEYGATVFTEGGKIRTFTGPSASVGWRLELSLASLF